MSRTTGLGIATVIVVGLVAGVVLKAPPPDAPDPKERPKTMNLEEYSDQAPDAPLRLLFIHHSCGGQLLAPVGPEDTGDACIYDTAVNGGGLRPMLTAAGYEVHEASYESVIGQDTDTFHWLPKFREHMDRALRTDHQDRQFDDERRNQIVMFKSCYPNNLLKGPGAEPGDPAGPELNVANAKATFRALLPLFAAHPEVLFVHVTAPATLPRREGLAKTLLKRALGKTPQIDTGRWARAFNRWLVDADQGWLAGYAGTNVVVFDYYDVLTGHGRSNFSIYGSGPDGLDDHPSREGNEKAAKALLPFLNRAVRRAGLNAAPAADLDP